MHKFQFFKQQNLIEMKEGWVLVFSSLEHYQAKIAEDVLKQHGIESHILSKPDSAIPSLGVAELYAPQDKAREAEEVLKANRLK
jgi:hypothetical protein